jgi:hypothetical protein
MIVGFTGHQRIDHPERWTWVRGQFARILEETASPGDRVMTALAEGADQLFAEVALTAGVPVEVIVPCQRYETAFSDPAARARYRRLLTNAAAITKLDFAAPSEEAYLAAGKHIVERADLLVALWNGKPAAGKGGTGDIVEYARSRGRAVIHVDPDIMQVLG